MVKNANWYFDNVVLLGDALHTAHFSIGSGTKLAMEDAIAMANHLRKRTEISKALEEFEATRKPYIEEYQSAAFESMRWFENIGSYDSLSLLNLAMSSMLRSGRVTYEDLRERDPQFVGLYEESK